MKTKISFPFVLDALVIAFWLWLAYNQFILAVQLKNPVTFLLAAESLLIGYFLFTRRPETSKPHPWYIRAAILFAVFLGPLLVKIQAPLPTWAALLSASGVLLTLWALFSLGRSFGVTPADRGLVTRGPYKYLRHPMYAGAFVNLAVVVAFNLTPLNALILLAALAVDICRILIEERTVSGYDAYASQVRWRLIPFVW